MSSYVFIDSRVGKVDGLMAGFATDSIVVMLDPWQDGIRQIATALAGQSAVDSIHIVSHGADGTLYLGNTVLRSDNLDYYRNDLAAIGSALSADGDILFYGCNVAATAAGQRFIEQLAACTQADVAASADATGAAAQGGNWQLEAATGRIDSGTLNATAYGGLLDVIIGDNNPNLLIGTANNDVISGLGGDDTLNGAAGFDRAVYSAASAGYSISFNDGNFIVTDTNPANGNEGTDRLINIEAAQFTDGTVAAGLAGFQVKGVVGTGLPNGGFVATWVVGDFGVGSNLYAQRYDAAGVAQGPEIWVNSSPIQYSFGGNPAATALPNGGFVVTWGVSQYGEVHAQLYDAAGVPQGYEFQVGTTRGGRVPTPDIATLADGGFVVAWGSNTFLVENNHVYAQRYDAAGMPQGPQIHVNTIETVFQTEAKIAALSNGGFVVAWQSSDAGTAGGVCVQRYDAAGVAQGAAVHPANALSDHAIVGLSNGG